MIQKKRHNPPILEEDRAVKAFDSGSGLDKIVEQAKENTEPVSIAKTDEASRKELYNLVVKVFGNDLYCLGDSFGTFTENVFTGQQIELDKKTKQKWYQKKKVEQYLTLEVDFL
ncbi:hypothetical protein HY837_02970, partial [archaeon]|nr:hypothetical protein [archaeon]